MSEYIDGNQITLLRNGADFFPALEAAFDSASFEIHLETYIYRADVTGHRIGDALKRAAQRGVSVNVLLDGFGSKDLPRDFVKTLEMAGVKIMFYRPQISPWTLKRNRLRRLHRKVTVIDGRIAFVGGINIIDDFDTPRITVPRLDYAVQIQGALLPAIHANTRKLWQRISRTHLRKSAPVYGIQELITASGNMRAAFLVRDNVLHRREIEHAYLTAIANAKSEIIIANAYFLPGRHFRRVLLNAAKRGVCIKLLLQGRMEYLMMFATHAFYSVFLRHNIEIYEYNKGYMHSKVAVIDGEWATVGSSNIDPFSLLLAREANIVVRDKNFAAELRQDIITAMAQDALHIKAEVWQRGHIFRRLITWVMYGIMRFGLGIIGYPNQL